MQLQNHFKTIVYNPKFSLWVGSVFFTQIIIIVARRFKRICHPLASEHTLCVKESVHSFVVCCKLRLSKPSNRPVLLIKSVVISSPPEMFYGAIKDALMIRYEYSAEWQLISRQSALTRVSSTENLAYITQYSHHFEANFTCCPPLEMAVDFDQRKISVKVKPQR